MFALVGQFRLRASIHAANSSGVVILGALGGTIPSGLFLQSCLDTNNHLMTYLLMYLLFPRTSFRWYLPMLNLHVFLHHSLDAWKAAHCALDMVSLMLFLCCLCSVPSITAKRPAWFEIGETPCKYNNLSFDKHTLEDVEVKVLVKVQGHCKQP